MTIERFMEKVDVQEDGCWLWEGGKNQDGYGLVYLRVEGKSTSTTAHRWLFVALIGSIEAGHELDHAECERRDCVNPAHLEPVTHAVNIQRGRAAMKTHCKFGHELSEGNYYTPRNGSSKRQCKQCHYRRSRAYYIEKRAAALVEAA